MAEEQEQQQARAVAAEADAFLASIRQAQQFPGGPPPDDEDDDDQDALPPAAGARAGVRRGDLPGVKPWKDGIDRSGDRVIHDLADDRDAWARQPNESGKAYAAFCAYRDLGVYNRSLIGTARVMGNLRGRTQINRWAKQWRWEERAELWDDEQRKWLDGKRRETQSKAIDNHANASRALMGQAMKILQVQQQRGEPDPRSVQQAAIALDKAIHHNRLALGLPTDVSKDDVRLKGLVEESIRLQDRVRAVMEEHLCDDCRERVGGELRRLAKAQRRVAEEAQR